MQTHTQKKEFILPAVLGLPVHVYFSPFPAQTL